jgi:sugar/nucleoside kinase (ribokinase family)
VIRPLAMELYKRAGCKILMLKLGERGMLTYRAPSHDVRSFFTIDSFVERLVDPVGAGDALLAYATVATVASGSEVVASILATIAAAVACEHDGNTPVTPEQVLAKVNAVEKRVQFA